jgi:hypothetical protein
LFDGLLIDNLVHADDAALVVVAYFVVAVECAVLSDVAVKTGSGDEPRMPEFFIRVVGRSWQSARKKVRQRAASAAHNESTGDEVWLYRFLERAS